MSGRLLIPLLTIAVTSFAAATLPDARLLDAVKSENTALVTELGAAYVKGLQNINGKTDLTNPQTVLLSQIVTVDRGARYRISFHAMTKSFVSAASPVVRVIDASDEKLAVLGEAIVSANASGWQNYAVDFMTGQNTQAVRVIVRRTNCPNNSCAAFGTVWFDSFSLDHAAEPQR